jgi:DNA-binding response OmpR family regulator
MSESGETILAVDDSRLNLTRLHYYLSQSGYQSAQAENGQQALAMLRERPYALVLLDIMMPELSGSDVLRHMKNDPMLRNIPVIVISAFDDMACVVECIEMGAEDYLLKPFDPVLLRARISASLEKKRLRDAEQAYLEQVARVTAAAAAVEAGTFDISSLDDVACRTDDLGQMARVFQEMARNVYTREQQLRQQVRSLQIEIDQSRMKRQVSEITETNYFKDLQQQAHQLRNEASAESPPDTAPGDD